MRYQKVDLEGVSKKDLLEFQDDIDFYQIHPLVKLLEKELLPPKPSKNAMVTVSQWYPLSGAQNTWESL